MKKEQNILFECGLRRKDVTDSILGDQVDGFWCSSCSKLTLYAQIENHDFACAELTDCANKELTLTEAPVTKETW